MSIHPKRNKIWIDLDNSPHVPLFTPIVFELNKSGYQTLLTIRDCAQTCQLADLFELRYLKIGRHYGKNKMLKIVGTIYRAFQLMRKIKNERPALAVSHGSRAQMLASWVMRIPSIVIMDYEHVKGFLKPTWLMMPEIINLDPYSHPANKILNYPGIKEDVYVPSFQPDEKIRIDLGLNENDIIVTIRPPANEAHYHNPESEDLFDAAIDYLGKLKSVRMIVLPRNDSQQSYIRKKWPHWLNDNKIIIPPHVVDGLNLLWHSDLAISGGGTMNREAAALGIPVYSIFRGKIGGVDKYLETAGRLVLLKNLADVNSKIRVQKKVGNTKLEKPEKAGKALTTIVEHLIRITSM